MTAFNGDYKYHVDRFIVEFNEMSALLNWDELQKLIYAMRMLKGSAKQFISCERGITLWAKLQEKLRREFRSCANSATIHSQLRSRKRRPDESSRQYLYAMQEIAVQGEVEGAAIIEYIIDGLDDEEVIKAILYEANTVEELKSKLLVYDKIKSKSSAKKTFVKSVQSRNANNRPSASEAGSSRAKRQGCYNCGSLEHNANNCPHKSKGPKCFGCQQFGYLSSQCKDKNKAKSAKKVSDVSSVSGLKAMQVNVIINNVQCVGLVDTESEFNLVREDVFGRMNSVELKPSALKFVGLGQTLTEAIGMFDGYVMIQGSEYSSKDYVIPKVSMSYKLIIGHELLNHTKIT